MTRLDWHDGLPGTDNGPRAQPPERLWVLTLTDSYGDRRGVWLYRDWQTLGSEHTAPDWDEASGQMADFGNVSWDHVAMGGGLMTFRAVQVEVK